MLRLRIVIDPSGENSTSADVQLQKLGRKNAFTFFRRQAAEPAIIAARKALRSAAETHKCAVLIRELVSTYPFIVLNFKQNIFNLIGSFSAPSAAPSF